MAIANVQAFQLKAGDSVGKGETVQSVTSGRYTPKGHVEVTVLGEKNGHRYIRTAVWSRTKLIGVTRHG